MKIPTDLDPNPPLMNSGPEPPPPPQRIPRSAPDTPTHPHTHTPTHPHTHTPTHPLTHTPTHPHTHTPTHPHTHTPTHPHTHTPSVVLSVRGLGRAGGIVLMKASHTWILITFITIEGPRCRLLPICQFYNIVSQSFLKCLSNVPHQNISNI